MSYIQIELSGKKRGLKFNQMAIIVMSQTVDQENYAATANYAMIWAGLKANAYMKREELDLTFEEVCDAVDLLTPETLDEVAKVLTETEKYKELIAATEKAPETDKKKSKRTIDK